MSLTRYHAKRNFSRTREPKGRQPRAKKTPSNKIIFVVQKHAATRLHYDFRLEIGGVLKSWAVPKTFPVVRGEKRLAMQVEDHPREYGSFEGVIPKGQYGGGTVMLWDAGICEVLENTPDTALREDKMALRLEGQKLKGHWTLVHLRARAEDRDENAWLLIKSTEDVRPISKREDDRSVLSGRTMKQIAAMADATWQSNRNQKSVRLRRTPTRKTPTLKRSPRMR
jgi:bifunctional non-homologous end joining protein LigD